MRRCYAVRQVTGLFAKCQMKGLISNAVASPRKSSLLLRAPCIRVSARPSPHSHLRLPQNPLPNLPNPPPHNPSPPPLPSPLSPLLPLTTYPSLPSLQYRPYPPVHDSLVLPRLHLRSAHQLPRRAPRPLGRRPRGSALGSVPAGWAARGRRAESSHSWRTR